MSWTDDLRKDLKARYRINVEVVENLALKFGKWQHRITMDVRTQPSKSDPTGVPMTLGRYYQQTLQSDTISKNYVNRGLNVHWRANGHEMFVYTNDVDEFLSVLIPSHLKRVRVVEYMRPELAKSYAAGPVSQYKTSLTVKKLLPYGMYRYKIHVATNKKIRTNIGKKSLAAVVVQLDNYKTLLPERFRERATLLTAYSDNYFYAMDLDWLMMISLIDPRYIKRIEEIKTIEEVENEQLDPNTASAQPNP